jgi:hypothetical protein
MRTLVESFFRWLLLGLKPPELPQGREPTADELCKYRKYNSRWKRAIAYALWTILVCGSLHLLWGSGALTDWVGPGYAYAADVEKKAADLNGKVDLIASSLNRLVVSTLRSDMRETRRLHCLAKKDGNQTLAEKYWEDLDAMKEQFYEIMERDWAQPPCEDI